MSDNEYYEEDEADNEYYDEDEDGFKTWALEGLEAHNEYRALHDAPPLTLSKEVSDDVRRIEYNILDVSFEGNANN